jgi:hypothetical protein
MYIIWWRDISRLIIMRGVAVQEECAKDPQAMKDLAKDFQLLAWTGVTQILKDRLKDIIKPGSSSLSLIENGVKMECYRCSNRC